MSAASSTIKQPSRGIVFNMINKGMARHGLAFQKTSTDIAKVIRTADYDALIDLAFFAISNTGSEEAHKDLFLERCERLGLQ